MDRCLVRGSSSKDTLSVTFFIGLVVTVLATWIGLANEFAIPVLGFLAVGLAILLAFVVMLLLAPRLRQWARVHDDGFALLSRAGERFIQDTQIVAMAVTRETYAPQGRAEGTLRRCYLWVCVADQSAERLVLETPLKPNQVDPLQGLMIRLETRLLLEANGKLLGGKPIEEQDWRIERGALSVKDKQQWRTCPLQDVSAVDFYSECLCIWTSARAERWAQIPERAANSYILYTILRAELAKHPRVTLPAAGKDALGRLLFERATGRPGVALLGSGTFLLLGVLFLMIGFQQPIIWFFACIFLAVAGTFLYMAHSIRRVRIRCFAEGICYVGWRSTRTLRFDEVAFYAYSMRLLYMRGAYAGSIFRLSLEPLPGSRRARIKFGFYDKKSNGDIERLHEQITAIVAESLAKELKNQRHAQWTPRLRLTATGVECKQFSLFSGCRVIVLPYADIEKHGFQGGTYRIWGRGNPKPVVSENCERANFYPGLSVFQELLKTRLT